MNIIYDNIYKNHPINTNSKNAHGCITEILDKIKSNFDDMLSKHSKVFALRFDIRYPKGDTTYDKNKINDFNYNFKRNLNREKVQGGHKVDPRLISVHEKHKSDKNHYHYLLLVNGNAHQSGYYLHQKANKIWKNMLDSSEDGLVDFCNTGHKNGIMIDKNSPEFEKQYNEAFYQASYLAKKRGKENPDKGAWLVKSGH